MLNSEDRLETLNVLDIHTSIQASKYVEASYRFNKWFGKLDEAWEDSGEDGLNENSLKVLGSQLFNPYWAFMDIRNSDIKDILRKYKPVSTWGGLSAFAATGVSICFVAC